jgi:hypothetical protein
MCCPKAFLPTPHSFFPIHTLKLCRSIWVWSMTLGKQIIATKTTNHLLTLIICLQFQLGAFVIFYTHCTSHHTSYYHLACTLDNQVHQWYKQQYRRHVYYSGQDLATFTWPKYPTIIPISHTIHYDPPPKSQMAPQVLLPWLHPSFAFKLPLLLPHHLATSHDHSYTCLVPHRPTLETIYLRAAFVATANSGVHHLHYLHTTFEARKHFQCSAYLKFITAQYKVEHMKAFAHSRSHSMHSSACSISLGSWIQRWESGSHTGWGWVRERQGALMEFCWKGGEEGVDLWWDIMWRLLLGPLYEMVHPGECPSKPIYGFSYAFPPMPCTDG